MLDVLGNMAALIICGAVWRGLRPFDLDAEVTRRALTGVVYGLFLPALVLLVLWGTSLGVDTLRISGVALGSTSLAVAGAWLGFHGAGVPRPAAGALVLAAAFPNVTYLGLPFLESVLGPWARGVAIQYDLYACTPLLLTAGIAAARWHGGLPARPGGLPGELLRVPPLWAAVAGTVLSLCGIAMPRWLAGWLDLLGAAVVPLMLFSIGLSLRWDCLRWRAMPRVLPVLLIQLLLMPLCGQGLARLLGLQGELLAAVVLEAAMPSMVLGMVLCDRFGLDTSLYAMAVTLSTLASMLTLPLWTQWLLAS